MDPKQRQMMMYRRDDLGGCEPLKPPSGNVFQPVRAMLAEQVEMGPEDYRGIMVPMVKNLTTTTASDTATYRVPNTHNLAVDRIIAQVAFNDISGETASLGNIGDATNLGFDDRLKIKLGNARVLLQNTDRTQNVIENGYMSLLTLHLNPIDWTSAPHLVPAGELLQAELSLRDTDPAVVGASTEYGIVLIGRLIRVKRS